MKLKVSLLKFDKHFNRPLLRLTNNRPWLFKLYTYTILPFRILLFNLLGGKPKNVVMGKTTLLEKYAECCDKFGKEAVERYDRDILACYIIYGIDPVEYFLFNFKDLDHDGRRQFLSDRERMYGSLSVMSWAIFDELKEKDTFYNMAGQFFGRDVCIVKPLGDRASFGEFVQKQPRFFGKPIDGTYGQGAGIFNISDYESVDAAFDSFASQGNWILEEIICQDSRLAAFNESSVNTIRVPSFMTLDGHHQVLNPTIRTGRKGFVVDNAGSGGVTAMIDVKTGKIATEGIDKKYCRFEKHPDSGTQFKGTQIPMWDELMKTAEAVHRSLPKRHRYVGFDFALSTKGWVLIEGNWGQLIGSQTASQKGVRYEFERLMGLPSDTCYE